VEGKQQTRRVLCALVHYLSRLRYLLARFMVASEAPREQRAQCRRTLADLRSLSSSKAPSADRVNVQGILRNYNTIEDFKNADKTALLDSLGDEVCLSLLVVRRS
jgi:hypothetical protein